MFRKIHFIALVWCKLHYPIHEQTTSKFYCAKKKCFFFFFFFFLKKVWNRNTNHFNGMTTSSSSMLSDTSLLSMKSTHMTLAREIWERGKVSTMRKSRRPGGGGAAETTIKCKFLKFLNRTVTENGPRTSPPSKNKIPREEFWPTGNFFGDPRMKYYEDNDEFHWKLKYHAKI